MIFFEYASLVLKIIIICLSYQTVATMYLRINRVAKDIKESNGGNSYTYTKVKNLLRGIKGQATKKEIQQLRKFLKNDFHEIDAVLAKLENE